jgi:methyl-accepting chemotaxis protein
VSYHKRTKRLVKSGLQLKLILTFVGLACVASLFEVILLNRAVTYVATQMPRDGGILLGELPGVLRSSVLLSLSVLVPVTIGVGLVLTHRLAGPIYRFETYLRGVIAGEQNGRCKIRDGDELHEFCELLNEAVAKLRAEAREAREELEALRGSNGGANDGSRSASPEAGTGPRRVA